MKNGQRPQGSGESSTSIQLVRRSEKSAPEYVLPPKYGPGVAVHPALRLGDLGSCHFVEAGTLWEEAADNPVHVLVAPPLGGAVWVVVVYSGPRRPAAEGPLHSGAVLEFAAVVHGDTPEDLPEVLPHPPF